MDTEDTHTIVNHRRLDRLRRGRGPVAEHVIDEFVAGHLPRREFLRRGTMIGLSLPLLVAILDACASSSSVTSTGTPKSSSGVMSGPATGQGKPGATIRAGILAPAAAINPLTIADPGATQLLGQVGEWLAFTDQHFNYHPWLATSWSSNADGFNYADFQKNMVGTGRFVNKSYNANQGATFARNNHYWGKPAPPEKVEFTFYPEESPMTAALEGGSIDTNGGFSAHASPQLLNGSYNVIALRQSTHLMRHLSSTPTFTTASPPLKRTSMASTRPRSQSFISGTLGSLKAHPDIPIDHRASARTFS
jgi:ABC-type transport system substrate-binding protein